MNAKPENPIPIHIVIIPSCLIVDSATIFFESWLVIPHNPPKNIVMAPNHVKVVINECEFIVNELNRIRR